MFILLTESLPAVLSIQHPGAPVSVDMVNNNVLCAASWCWSALFLHVSTDSTHQNGATMHRFYWINRSWKIRFYPDSLKLSQHRIDPAAFSPHTSLPSSCSHIHLNTMLVWFLFLLWQHQVMSHCRPAYSRSSYLLRKHLPHWPPSSEVAVCGNYPSLAALHIKHGQTRTAFNMATWRQHPLDVGGRHYNSSIKPSVNILTEGV